MALGAILTFAVHWSIAGLDLRVIGWVLMLAGAFGLVLFFVFWNRRRTTRVVTGATGATGAPGPVHGVRGPPGVRRPAGTENLTCVPGAGTPAPGTYPAGTVTAQSRRLLRSSREKWPPPSRIAGPP